MFSGVFTSLRCAQEYISDAFDLDTLTERLTNIDFVKIALDWIESLADGIARAWDRVADSILQGFIDAIPESLHGTLGIETRPSPAATEGAPSPVGTPSLRPTAPLALGPSAWARAKCAS